MSSQNNKGMSYTFSGWRSLWKERQKEQQKEQQQKNKKKSIEAVKEEEEEEEGRGGGRGRRHIPYYKGHHLTNIAKQAKRVIFTKYPFKPIFFCYCPLRQHPE